MNTRMKMSMERLNTLSKSSVEFLKYIPKTMYKTMYKNMNKKIQRKKSPFIFVVSGFGFWFLLYFVLGFRWK